VGQEQVQKGEGMSEFTRRNFMKTAGVSTGAAIAAGYNPLSYGQNDKKIRVGCIGTGGQGHQLLSEGIRESDAFEVVAVADVYLPHQKGGKLKAWLSNAQVVLERGIPTPEQKEKLKKTTEPTPYYDYTEMLATEKLDAVIIATPPHTHYKIIMDCLKAGKHVFCESPLAIRIKDGRKIVKRAQKTGLTVQMGHVRRYHPNYNLAMKQFREDRVLGRLTRMEINLHRNSPGRRVIDNEYPFNDREQKFIKTDLEHHLNWRLYTEISGGPFLDILPRNIDTANWFCGTPPTRVFASGCTDYWKDGRTTPDNLAVIFDYHRNRRQKGFVPIETRNDHQNLHKLNVGHTMRCAWSYHMTNAMKGSGEWIHGDEGSMSLSMNQQCALAREAWVSTPYIRLPKEEKIKAIIKVFNLDPRLAQDQEKIDYYLTAGTTRFPVPTSLRNYPTETMPFYAVGSEEDAEVHQFRAFAHHIRNGGTPRANVMVGLAAVIAGDSARKSLETGNAVDINPALMEFDFETPSITDYAKDVEAIEA
jgi:predicted dehydrogenase